MFPYPLERSDMDKEEQSTGPLLGVSVALPDSIIFLEDPHVARWDDAGRSHQNNQLVQKTPKCPVHFHPEKQWRLDGFANVSYEKEEAKISIKMASFHPLVLLQETYVNFPFQNWELRPLGQDEALFTINGALINLGIKIQVTDNHSKPPMTEEAE